MDEAETGREQLLIRAFVGLADTLVDDYDVIDLLDRLVGYSVELLAADAAGHPAGRRTGRVAGGGVVQRADRMDRAAAAAGRRGPLCGVLPHRRPGQHHRPGRRRSRAGRGCAAAARRQQRYRSVHALPLRLRGEAIGAMNLFHHQPGPLPAADLALGQALADVATIGILQERAIRRGEVLNEQLQTALNSRVIIEQAKGVLAQHGNLTMDAAFDRLRSYARGHNLRLSEVAHRSSTPTSPQPCSPPPPPPGYPQRESGDGAFQGDQVRSWLRRPASTMVSPSSSSAAPS